MAENEVRTRATGAVITNALFRWESLVTIAITAILFLFVPAPFPWWQAWFWIVAGADRRSRAGRLGDHRSQRFGGSDRPRIRGEIRPAPDQECRLAQAAGRRARIPPQHAPAVEPAFRRDAHPASADHRRRERLDRADVRSRPAHRQLRGQRTGRARPAHGAAAVGEGANPRSSRKPTRTSSATCKSRWTACSFSSTT